MPKGVRPSSEVIEKYVKKQMPEVSNIPVSPLTWFGKMKAKQVGPGTSLFGLYNPLSGGVEVNPELAGSQDYEDTLVHELTHARQGKERGFLGQLYDVMTSEGEPYGRRPSELEAFQAETENRRRQGKSLNYMVRPSWDQPGKYISRGDIELRK